MSLTFATLLLFSQAAASEPADWEDRTARVFATIQHSEWCPAGNVMLDLQTGKFAYTAGAPKAVCNDDGLERRILQGRLSGQSLDRLRASFAQASVTGLESPVCRDGGKPDYIIISNGGIPTLVMTTGAYTEPAPQKWECWSEAASALHNLLDETFAPERDI